MDIEGMKVDIDDLDRTIAGDPDGLLDAFYWSKSEQGGGYWSKQYREEAPLDIESLKEIREAYYKSKGAKVTSLLRRVELDL